ncbi:hypothetical protein QBC39DRAFT_362090 [Podospora conica]|nr:hypothetical protein QBC39DRAFT_362090 [Schizothecium conicum]
MDKETSTKSQGLLTATGAEPGLSPQSSALLNVMSHLDPKRIKWGLVKNDDIRPLIPDYPKDHRFREAMKPLLSHSSPKIFQEPKTKILSMNPVVQEEWRQKMTNAELLESFQGAVSLLTAQWFHFEDTRHAGAVVAHVESLMKNFRSLLNRNISLEPGTMIPFTILLTLASAYFREQENWDKSLRLAKFALKVAEPFKSTKPQRYGNISMCISSTYHCMGKPEDGNRYYAITNIQDLAIEEQESDRGPALFALAYTELALGMLLNGHYLRAWELTSKARQVLKETAEFKDKDYWHQWTDCYYAWSLIATGQPEEAERALKDAITWLQGRKTKKELITWRKAHIYQIRGAAYEKMGNIKYAIRDWEFVVKLHSEIDNGGIPTRANQVRIKLGEYYGRQCAEKHLQKDATYRRANDMFDSARFYFSRVSDNSYIRELALSLFKRAEFLSCPEAYPKPSNVAAETRLKAETILLQIRPELQRKKDNNIRFVLEDFTEAVMIMSR